MYMHNSVVSTSLYWEAMGKAFREIQMSEKKTLDWLTLNNHNLPVFGPIP